MYKLLNLYWLYVWFHNKNLKKHQIGKKIDSGCQKLIFAYFIKLDHNGALTRS